MHGTTIKKGTSRHYVNFFKILITFFGLMRVVGVRINPVSNIIFGNHFIFFIGVIFTGRFMRNGQYFGS